MQINQRLGWTTLSWQNTIVYQKHLKIGKNVSYLLFLMTTPASGICFIQTLLLQALHFYRVLPIFCGWPADCLTRTAWHIQLWPVDQSGYEHLAQKCCMAAHPWSKILKTKMFLYACLRNSLLLTKNMEIGISHWPACCLRLKLKGVDAFVLVSFASVNT